MLPRTHLAILLLLAPAVHAPHVRLTWDAPVAGDVAVGHVIFCSVDGGVTYGAVCTTAVPVVSVVISNVMPGEYWYRVCGVSESNGLSEPSNVAVVGVPRAPVLHSIGGVGGSNVSLLSSVDLTSWSTAAVVGVREAGMNFRLLIHP